MLCKDCSQMVKEHLVFLLEGSSKKVNGSNSGEWILCVCVCGGVEGLKDTRTQEDSRFFNTC